MEVTLQQISKAVMPMIAASVAVLLADYLCSGRFPQLLPKALAKDGAYTGDGSCSTNPDTSSGDDADGSTAGNSSGNEDYNDIADYSDLGLGRADLELYLLHHREQYLGRRRTQVRRAHGKSNRRQKSKSMYTQQTS